MPKARLELQQLLSALCDGELTEAQYSRLEELLDTAPESRLLYLEYLDMHARLLLHPHLGADGPFPPIEVHDTTPQRDPAAEPGTLRGVPAESFPTLARPRRSIRQVLKYVVVAGATLAASLLVQSFWWRPPAPAQVHAASPPPGYVATLSQTVACAWDDPGEPRRAGSRLPAGDVRLRKGIARIRFDAGQELVIEGPTLVRLDSGTAATVLYGKVVFKADDTAIPFRLHTPSSTLVDLGTEYAILVSPEREEVHVFDGEVERTPSGGSEPEHLAAGTARRYEPAAGSSGESTPLDAARFVRDVADPARNPKAGLLVYEGFDYQDSDALQQGTLNGGQGWSSPWRPGFARPRQGGDPNRPALNIRESLSRPGAAVASIGGSFDHIGFSKYFRRLATPVRLHGDEVYYLSYLFRRDGPQAEPLNAVTIQLRTSEELESELAGKPIDLHTRLNVGVDRANDVFTHLNRVGVRMPQPLSYGETYLLVAKIVASSYLPDQVFVRVYAPHEPIERDEEGSWSVMGPLIESDLAFDWLEIHINSAMRQTIDEIRMGVTWSSVTDAWIGD